MFLTRLGVNSRDRHHRRQDAGRPADARRVGPDADRAHPHRASTASRSTTSRTSTSFATGSCARSSRRTPRTQKAERGIDVDAGRRRLSLAARSVRDLAGFVLQRERVPSAMLSIAFVSRRQIASLNKEHLGHEGDTDVITFALGRATPSAPLVGDIYVAPEVVRAQAQALARPRSRGTGPGGRARRAARGGARSSRRRRARTLGDVEAAGTLARRGARGGRMVTVIALLFIAFGGAVRHVLRDGRRGVAVARSRRPPAAARSPSSGRGASGFTARWPSRECSARCWPEWAWRCSCTAFPRRDG